MTGIAGAQTPADTPMVSEEVVVWGEQHVRQSRAVVIRAMERLGWKASPKRRDERVVFRPPEAWMGRAFLAVDGQLTFGRPVIAVEPAIVPGTQVDYDPDVVLNRMDGSGVTAGASAAVLPSKAKLAIVHQGVRERLLEPLSDYVTVYRETHFRTLMAALPEQLDGLFTSGVRLDGAPGLVPTVAERRLMVLAYWSDLRDDPDGLALSAVVETWIREVIQTSDTPFTPAEIRAAEADRLDGRRLIVE